MVLPYHSLRPFLKQFHQSLLARKNTQCYCSDQYCVRKRGMRMRTRKKILDYEYEEVLDTKTRELIRVGCAIAVGCPT